MIGFLIGQSCDIELIDVSMPICQQKKSLISYMVVCGTIKCKVLKMYFCMRSMSFIKLQGETCM